MMMTKTHFEAFATKIRFSDQPFETRFAMAELVIQVARHFNPRFDRARFLRAAGLDDAL